VSKQAFGLCLVVIITGCLLVPVWAGQTMELGNSATEIQLLNQDQSELIIQVDIRAVDINEIATKEGPFIMMTVDGFTHSNKIGEPSLPTINRILSVPFGCELITEVIESEVEEFSLAELKLNQPLIPVQPPLSKSADPDDVPFEYNRALYQQSGYYGLPAAEAKILGTMRSLHLGMISISPFEYDPTTNNVKVYKHLVVRVSYLHPDWALSQDMRRRYHSSMFEPVYNKLFNYEAPEAVFLNDLVTYPVKYLIIASRMFESQLQPFIAWKKKKGFNVIVAYTDVIGTSASAIKTYIQNQYNGSTPPSDPAPSFVLLVGDTPQIPTWDGSAGSHVTDLRYCEFTGDDYPEIYYGRFSAQNTGELQPQIDKTLEYEQYTMPDPSYLAEVTLIAGADATYAITHGNGQINYGTNNYFNAAHGITDHTWLYPASDQYGVSDAVIQTVNDGVGFANYTAHCGHTGWGTPSFTVSDINNLTNAHKYLLGIGNCCLSNTFDESTPCFGEAWLQAANKGGVGYIGGSNSTWWDEDYWWGVGAGPVIGAGPTYEQTGIGAYDGVFHDHGEAVSLHYVTNAAIMLAGNIGVDEGNGSHVQYYWEIYHLMGDPSVMNYMGVPLVNTISHANTILLLAAYFTVNADPGSYVGISINGVLHGAAYIGQSGTVNVPITPFDQPGVADIVITAQNRQPYISTVQVISPDGAYIVYDDHAINDVAGNNNGLVDFGESILLDMQLQNVGPDAAGDVSAVLTTVDSYVTITDGSQYFGTIAGNFGTVNITDAYAFNVSANTPDAHNIQFHLEITGTSRDTWTGDFVIPVHAPDVDFAAVAINDESGNGNGILEAGETASVVVTLVNSGSGTAYSVAGTLSESDAYVTITDPNGGFGNLSPSGGSGDNTGDAFVVVADGSFPQGHSVTFNLGITADGGYANSLQFELRTAESFEYNNGGYTGAGNWQWGIPTSGPSGAYFGARVWGTILGGNYDNSRDDALISPQIHVHSPAAALEFYHWYYMEDNYDGGNVSISTDGGTSWTLITPAGGYPDSDVYALDEPDYVNQDIKVRWRFASDGSINYAGWYIDDVSILNNIPLPPPDLSYSPSSFTVSTTSGETEDRTLTLNNSGDGPLYYQLATQTDERLVLNSGKTLPAKIASVKQQPIGYTQPSDKPGTRPEPYFPPMTLGSGGPDAFGYSWIDSDDPNGPTYSWKDITSIGTPITGLSDDTNLDPIPIGFNFEFYGNTFNSFRFCTNGFISFTSTVTSYTNYSIPTGTSEPHNLIAPFWDDLNFNDSGDAYYRSTGDSLIISYVNVVHYYLGGSGPYTFQVILLANGNIIFQYQDINPPDNSATIGIQNSDGSIGLQVVYNAAYVQENLAIMLTTQTGWLEASPASGIVPARLSADANPNAEIPVTFSVGLDAAIIELNLSSIVDTVETGQLSTVDLIIGNIGTIDLNYTATDNRAWISELPINGTVGPSTVDTVAATLDASSLPEGNYSGDITISSNATNNSTVVLPVTFVITGPPVEPDISLNLSAIVDTVVEGEYADVELIVSNGGSGDLNYTLSDDRGWLEENPDNGIIAPAEADSVTITLDASSYSQGTYTGTITVNSNDPDSGSIPIPVTMVVIEASPACEYIPGDINGDGSTIGSDITFGVNFFRGSGVFPPDSCWDDENSIWLDVAGDVNGDCQFIGSDITYYVGFFRGTNSELNFCPRLPPYTPPVLGVPIETKDEKLSIAPTVKIKVNIPEKDSK